LKRTLFAVAFLISCSSSATTTPGVTDSASPDDSSAETIGDVVTVDTTGDVAPFPVRRLPCTPRGSLATDLPLDQFGALEGEIVSLVPPGTGGGCPADADHLHLQVDVSGKRYDVAVTIASVDGTPMAIMTKDLAPALPATGWSTAGFDLAKDIGVASADYTSLTKGPLLARLESELATASRVGIHGRSYTDGTGLHNVHRNGGAHDGVILMRRNGVGGTDHAVALRFSGDVF
jgi:hypothetical protein